MAEEQSTLTPMKRQYNAIKERNQDSILFFRLGDFYEMFDEDAKVAAKELDLTLTTRDRNKPKEDQTPMCGVPYHSVDAYIARLVAKGYKVAYATSADGEYKLLKDTTATSVTHTGAKAGMVIYTTNKTIYVTPKGEN